MRTAMVFYQKFPYGFQGRSGQAPVEGHIALPMTHTHVLDILIPYALKFDAALDAVYRKMQAEYWSLNGEAMTLLEQKLLRHTSMSPGDVIYLDGSYHLVGGQGFAAMSFSAHPEAVPEKYFQRAREACEEWRYVGAVVEAKMPLTSRVRYRNEMLSTSRLDRMLMLRFGFTESDARTVNNTSTQLRSFVTGCGDDGTKIAWIARWPRPNLECYAELWQWHPEFGNGEIVLAL